MKKKSVASTALNSESKDFNQAAAAESTTACTRAVRAVDGRDHGEGAMGRNLVSQYPQNT
jgi:hypothetical protein